MDQCELSASRVGAAGSVLCCRNDSLPSLVVAVLVIAVLGAVTVLLCAVVLVIVLRQHAHRQKAISQYMSHSMCA